VGAACDKVTPDKNCIGRSQADGAVRAARMNSRINEMALNTFDEQRLRQLQPDELSDSLERGSIVYFPRSPVPLPSAEDLEFFRSELPKRLKLKNISYPPKLAERAASTATMTSWSSESTACSGMSATRSRHFSARRRRA
jgi:hypothetical protein